MSKIEEVLYQALEDGIYQETMSLALEMREEYPKMEAVDRYEIAYERIKVNLLKSQPPLNT
tara:strand:- start:131 stop:313 length:183 start_codon:yes stop_codon:yes gene_type:complete